MNTTEVMKQALEALESCTKGDYSTSHVIHPWFDEAKVEEAESELTAAIAELEQAQPVCYLREEWLRYEQSSDQDIFAFPVYAAPRTSSIPTRQEPVAWWNKYANEETWEFLSGKDPNGMLNGEWVPLYTHPAPAIPTGWRLVPVEPTEGMLDAMCQQLEFSGAALSAAYHDAIAVAPQPPKE